MTETREFIREIKAEGLYLMLTKNKKDLLFYCEDSPREDLLKRIQENSDVLVMYLKKNSYLDA